ncbi:MAG: hypothetical protein R6V23_03265 [Bacteroidales bacterium]
METIVEKRIDYQNSFISVVPIAIGIGSFINLATRSHDRRE